MLYLIIAVVFLYIMGFLSSLANWRFIIGKRDIPETILLFVFWWALVMLGLVTGRTK